MLTAIIIAILAFVGAAITTLDVAVILAIVIGLAVLAVAALLVHRIRRLEKAAYFSAGPLRGHLRIDHLEADLALARAQLILSGDEGIDADEDELMHVVGAALVAGFRVEPATSQGRMALPFR